MSVPRLEALADAIMHHEGWFPGSRSYDNRNPGNLMGSFLVGDRREYSYRIFGSLVEGYLALLRDLGDKVSGRTSTGLNTTSTLGDLISVWAPASAGNDVDAYVKDVSEWCTKALGVEVNADTPLSFFSV